MKVVVLALFVLSCSCQEVIEVSGDKVVRSQDTHLPLRTVSGISSISGLTSGLPVSSSYFSGGNSISSLGLNQGYLGDLRQRVFGQSVNIAPSPLSYLPFGQSQNLLAIRQPSFAVGHRPIGYAIGQPAIHVAQPHAQVHLVRPQVAGLSIAHQGIAVARPQVLSAQQQVHPVNAAIQQVARTVEYRPVPFTDQPIVPQEVVVEPSDQPINIHFKSRSSTVRISQEHQAGEPGSVEQTQSQDDPSRVVHEVVKPVVQEVREVIQPYRQVTQEIQPVVENVHTVVSHGEGQRAQYVSEPIIRQQLVRPAVQQFAVQQPLIRQVAVAQPQFQTLSVPQYQHLAVQQVPQYQHLAVHQVPQYQHLSVQQVPQYQHLAIPQYQQLRVAQQPFVQQLSVAQPVSYGVRSVGVAQPVVGVNRVVSTNEPSVFRSEELREARPVVTGERSGSDFVKYVESNQ